MSHKLSFEKFYFLIQKENYTIDIAYYTPNITKDNSLNEGNILFLDILAPISQKSLFVKIPKTFNMILKDEIVKKYKCKFVKINESNSQKSKISIQSIEYINHMKSMMINTDIVLLSVFGIYYCKDDDERKCELYSFNISNISNSHHKSLPKNRNIDDIKDKEVNTNVLKNKDSKDSLKNIQNELKKLSKKNKIKVNKECIEPIEDINTLDPNIIELQESDKSDESSKLNEPSVQTQKSDSIIIDTDNNTDKENIIDNAKNNGEQVEKADDTKIEITNGTKLKTPVKLVFKDSVKIHRTYDLKSFKNNKNGNKDIKDIYGCKGNIKNHSNIRGINNNIESIDMNLGIIYLCINLDIFYERIKDIEADILEFYDQLFDNEFLLRKTRLSKVKDNLQLCIKNLDESINNITIKERRINYQLSKLNTILIETERIKKEQQNIQNAKKSIDTKSLKSLYNIEDKIKNGENNANTLNNIIGIQDKTKESISDLNIKLLKYKDEAEDLLVNYEEITKELLSLI